jgi:NAD(P)H-hydrate epimerase
LGFDRANALDTARALAEAAGAVAVCKGPGSVIAAPDGRARIDPTGTAVLATAGTGDVLTGVIAGLAARRVDPFDAAWAGVYLHGSAGRIAATRTGEGSVAGDVSAAIPRAVAAVRGPS